MHSATDEFEQNFKRGNQDFIRCILSCATSNGIAESASTSTRAITQIAGGSGIQGLQRGDEFSARHDNRERQSLLRRLQKNDQNMIAGKAHSKHPYTAVQSRKRLLTRQCACFNGAMSSKRPGDSTTSLQSIISWPTIRWNEESRAKLTDYSNPDSAYIKANFQLLKKSNGSVSHNLLKSRACERCVKNRETREAL